MAFNYIYISHWALIPLSLSLFFFLFFTISLENYKLENRKLKKWVRYWGISKWNTNTHKWLDRSVLDVYAFLFVNESGLLWHNWLCNFLLLFFSVMTNRDLILIENDKDLSKYINECWITTSYRSDDVSMCLRYSLESSWFVIN